MKNDLTSRRVFAETVRASHSWPDASISDADCCEYEHSAWLAWDRAWTAATRVKDAEIAALKAENMALQEGLRDIADTPPFEAILDPQRAARVASEVMAQGVRPQQKENHD